MISVLNGDQIVKFEIESRTKSNCTSDSSSSAGFATRIARVPPGVKRHLTAFTEPVYAPLAPPAPPPNINPTTITDFSNDSTAFVEVAPPPA